MQKNNKYQLYWIGVYIWIICALFYAFEFFMRTSTGALTNYFRVDLGFDALTISWVGSSFYALYVIAQLPAGLAVDRYGIKKVMGFATLITVFGMIFFTYSTNYWMLGLSRGLIGFGGGFSFICSLKAISIWLPNRLFPAFTGFTQMFGYLGATISAVPLVTLLNCFEPSSIFLGVTGVSILLFVASTFLIKTHPNFHKHPTQQLKQIKILSSIKLLFSNKQLLLNGLYCLTITGTTAVFADLWGITYLTNVQHFSRADAAICTSMIYLGIAISSPIWGIIASASNNNKIWLVTSGLVGIFITCVLLYGNISIPIAIFLSFLFGSVQAVHVLNFSLVKNNVSQKNLGASIAMVNLFIPLSGFLFQPLSGFFINYFKASSSFSGAYEKALLIIPILMLISLGIAFFLKEK